MSSPKWLDGLLAKLYEAIGHAEGTTDEVCDLLNDLRQRIVDLADDRDHYKELSDTDKYGKDL